MLTWLPPTLITREHLALLAASISAAPAFERIDTVELVTKLHEGKAFAFVFPPQGLLIVEVRSGEDGSRRLSIIAFAGWQGSLKLAELAADLRHMGAEWKCDTIETLCYDHRLARAIVRIGGQVESWNLVLDVEG